MKTTGSSTRGRRRFAVENLEVFDAALEFLAFCDRLSAELWRRNSSLCRQLQRAAASVVTNIGEASSSLGMADRRRYFEYAYRSAGESAAAIIAFDRLGAFHDEAYLSLRALLHRIQGMLMRLMQRALRRSSEAARPHRSDPPHPTAPRPP